MPLTLIECFGSICNHPFDYSATPSFSCSSTVPMPVSLVSVERMNGPCLVRYGSTGGCTKAFLSARKACSQLLCHINLVSFLVKPVRRVATEAKLGI